jgi:hypothetical protein
MTEAEVIDAEPVADTPPAPESTPAVESHELVRRERRSEVIKPLDPDALVDSFRSYQELLPRLLTDADYQEAGRGKRFVKKSGWRKIATAFDLDVQIVRSVVDRDDTGTPQRAEVIARAIAPSGRSMDGDGYCDIAEDRFSGPRGNTSKLENDLRATATTRAMNRAISGLVGMGEVSAEEVSEPSGPALGPPVEDPAPASVALVTIVGGDPEEARKRWGEIKQACGGYMPASVADALVIATAGLTPEQEAA